MVALGPTASENRRTFAERGLFSVPEVVDRATITELRSSFWQLIEEKFAIREDDPTSWFANPHNPAGGSRARRLSGMNSIMDDLLRNGNLDAVHAAICRSIEATFGNGSWEPLDRWYSLLSFPGTETEWDVPESGWHNDLPIVVDDPEPWSLFVFVFLDRVERETGPTVTVTGSHRRGQLIAAEKGEPLPREVGAFDYVNSGLVADPATLRLLPVGDLLPELTASDRWFEKLIDETPAADRTAFLLHAGNTHEGIESRVRPVTGGAGDITLMDPRCLHTASANVSNRPRQVLRLDFRRRGSI